MRGLQYFYVFICFVSLLSGWLNSINATYSEDDKKDIQVFVGLLNVIRTWELDKIQFTQNELEQIKSIIIDGIQNPEDVEQLNTKFERKMTSLKCTYGYAVQNILLNLKSLLIYEESTDDSYSSASVEIKKRPIKKRPIEKKVKFSEEVKLIVIDKNDEVPISEIIKKNPVDLRNESGYTTQVVNDIIDYIPLDQQYLIDLQTIKLSSYIQNFVYAYKKCVNRMLSVVFMAKRVAANWLWNVSIMLSDVGNCQIRLKNLCNHSEINSTVNNFVAQCTDNNYLSRTKSNKNIVYGLGKNMNKIVNSLKVSFKLMEIFGLVTGSTEDLVPLFKYERGVRVYDFFWDRRQFDGYFFQYSPQLNSIDWYEIEKALNKVHTNVQNVWISDPFAIVNYYLVAKDVVSITLLYHVLKHFMVYIVLRWQDRETNENITADWFMNTPIQVLKDFLNVLDLNDDTFYAEVIHHLTLANSMDQPTFQIFTKTISFKLEQLLKRFGVFDKRIYINMSDQLSTNIDNTTLCECNDSLRIFYNTFIKFSYDSSFNLNIIKFLHNSEKETWMFDL
ncbi:uncharacterized protein LOC126835304 [Adelges cooleyi]|uniref:uncharacterized protein LOC126835304 n=1 Tax=Adelges cooleyi TaxID=133065 RepID=UPI0021808CE8|nr:uncharacterized protein LOC126835304 [Adelges cooleyi]